MRAKSWVKELQRQGKDNMVIVLVGNKLDLAEQRQVEGEEARQYAEENGIFFFETSAKTNQNVTELFTHIAKKLPKQVQPKAQPSVTLVAQEEPKKKGCC